MRNLFYIAALAILALTACSNDQNDIFDQSAAERLEQYKKDYAEVLTSNGGLWTMEYFSNSEEPGYLFVVKFNTDGSVDIHANHKWIGNIYKSETSLWKMTADNGPALSFSSYNSLFHIFADPANIIGSDAPTGDQGEDINETGYGHEGDYEFQVMDVSEDRNTMRLLGKKRMIDMYLRRLDSSVDIKQYMDDYKQIETNLFCKEVPNLLFTDTDGEKYVVKNAYTGVLSLFPEAGDEVSQTRSGNFIITMQGIRFMDPLEFENADGEERSISEFKFVNNYGLALVDNENAVLNFGSFENMLDLNHCSWKVDLKSMTGEVKDAFDNFTNQLRSLYSYKSASINDFTFDYDVANDSYLLRMYIRTASKSYETDRFFVKFSDSGSAVKIIIGDPYDNSSQLALNAYSEMQNIFSLLSSAGHGFSTTTDCSAKVVTFNIGSGSMTMTATK